MAERTTRSARWSWVVLAVVLAGSAYLVVRNARVITDTFADIGTAAIVLGGALGVAGTLTVGLVWLSLLRGLDGQHVPAVEASSTFFVAQLGKYVPGAVWPILAQVTAASRWHVRRSSIVVTNLVMMLLLAATGTLLGLVLLPWVADVGRPWLAWACLAVPCLLALLYPRTLPALSRRVRLPGIKLRFEIDLSDLAYVRAAAWSLVTWVCLGAQLWVLLVAAGAEGTRAVAVALGGAGIAWAAGLVAVFAPAGAGVREGVLVAVCAPLVGAAEALAVALACRLLLTLADVLMALLGAWWTAVARPEGPPGPRSAPGAVQK